MVYAQTMGWLGVLSLRGRGREEEPRPAVGFPIAVLSFDRPRYLKRVLASLRPQISPLDPVFLFQDGALNPWSGRLKANPRNIARCVALFRRHVPWGQVVQAGENLGIALNYERAERHLFDTLGAECALVLEDDMVLSRNYLAVTRQLLDLALRDERVGYVSAYGNFWAGLPEQRRRATELLPMQENWGAAMTRRSWLAERAFRLQYLALLAGRDYSERDHAAIARFYAARGWYNHISSQDAARWIACLERGAVRITTFACHARYIGAIGEHSVKETFRAAGYGATVMFDADPPALVPPSSGQIEAWLAAERTRFTTDGAPDYRLYGKP